MSLSKDLFKTTEIPSVNKSSQSRERQETKEVNYGFIWDAEYFVSVKKTVQCKQQPLKKHLSISSVFSRCRVTLRWTNMLCDVYTISSSVLGPVFHQCSLLSRTIRVLGLESWCGGRSRASPGGPAS